MRTLPPWNDSISDGCSVPSWLRWLIAFENEAQQMVCRAHDHAYYLGGSRKDREVADKQFYLGLLRVGTPRTKAWLYYMAVTRFGGPEWRRTGISWSFGGEVFAYTDAPATEVAA